MSRTILIASIAVTAAALAACGSSSSGGSSSSTSASTSPSTTSASAAPSTSSQAQGGGQGGSKHDMVRGTVASVNGSAIQVTQKNGTATVDSTTGTRFAMTAPAQLSDVAAGDCVIVAPEKDNAGTARGILVTPAQGGQCAPHPNAHGIAGTVASITPTSIVVHVANAPDATATLTPQTHVIKSTPATAQAVTAGVCIAARGNKDNSGNLQATMINLRQPVNGTCGR